MARILVVDDNPHNAKLARVVLSGAGHEVLTAADAEEAQALVRSATPQLILMDLQLPGMDGLELTRRLKSDPATAAIPVLALTANAMRGDDERARAAGCEAYITKPIDTRRLPEQVAAHLPAGGTP